MKGRLITLALSATGLGAVMGAGWWARKMDFIGEAAWFYLWPSLIAVAFLAFAVLALVLGARVWLWPLGTGFVVQTIGVLLLAARTFERSTEPLKYTLTAVAAVLLVLGAVWLTRFLRARWLERNMITGMADSGVDPKDLERIRQDMLGALDLLRRAGRGRNAIYELPWFLVIGRPAVGKTVAIKNSGLGLPVRKDWTKGVGGTYTADWFFTNDLIFMDTPGKWVQEGVNEESEAKWRQLLKLLRKYRGRRPLDGLVVLVSADDLLGLSEGELQDQAANIREVVDLLQAELTFRIPIYLLVSKTDLVEGFIDFFRGLQAQRRQEILGWSNDDPNRDDVAAMAFHGLERVQRQLAFYRYEMLAQTAAVTRSRRLFLFTENFKRLQEPLVNFAETLFHEDPGHETPVFRGFYFTSGTQGEGSPISRAMTELAGSLGISGATSQAADSEEPKRSYFLLELFRDLLVGDEGLVGRTALHWWRQRRNTMIGAFLPAGVAVVFLLMSFISLMWNRGTYREIGERVPAIVQQLESLGDLEAKLDAADKRRAAAIDEGRDAADGSPGAVRSIEIVDELNTRLDLTERLRSYHRELVGINPLRRLGMRRAGGLAVEVFDTFHGQLERAVLRPTLRRATTITSDPGYACGPRVDVLHSVVWLRMGYRFESRKRDMAGFDFVWSLNDPEEARAPRDKLLRQFGYLVKKNPSGEAGDLLSGFRMSQVAESIKRDCDLAGSASALESYGDFQESCEDKTTPAELRVCDELLTRAVEWRQEDYQRFIDHLQSLQQDLETIKNEEPEARLALDTLRDMELAPGETSDCVVQFSEEILPEIRKYAVQDEMLAECREALAGIGNRAERYRKLQEVLAPQQAALVEPGEDLKRLMADYNINCRRAISPLGFKRLEFPVLARVADGYRRAACMGFEGAEAPAAPAARPVAAARRPAVSVARRAAAPRPSVARYPGFENPDVPSSVYRPDGWQQKRVEWEAALAAVAGADEAIRGHEQRQIEAQIAGFASSAARSWLGYVDSLRVADPSTGLVEWIRGLAANPGYRTLLGRVADVEAIVEGAKDPPFDVVGRRLEPLKSVSELAAGRLPEYLALLGKVGEDLARCEQSTEFFAEYRRGVQGRAPDNSLVAAEAWVAREAGPALVEGKLRELFERPLREARQWVTNSTDLLGGLWSELSRVSGTARERFPFNPGADEVVDADTLRALLGGETGIVSRLGVLAKTGDLGTRSAAWLARASTLSAIFFEKGSDALRPIPVRLDIGEPVYESEKLSKNYQLVKAWMHLGEEGKFQWEPEDPDLVPTMKGKFQLFGDEASELAFVRGYVQERKGMFKRVLGKDWKEEEPVPAVSSSEPWAPLRVIRAGLAPDARWADGAAPLAYTVPVEISKKREGAITIHCTVSGEDLPELLRLLAEGLEPAPADFAR